MDTGEGEELEIIDRTELDITDTGVTDEEINITDLREEFEFADTGVTDEELALSVKSVNQLKLLSEKAGMM